MSKMQLISLSKGYTTKVDDDMYEELNLHKWHAIEVWTGKIEPHVSAGRWVTLYVGKRKCIRMHHQVFGIESEDLHGDIIDHEDRDSLNNQRYNLRRTNKSINALNSDHSTNATGIYYDINRKRYKAFLLNPRRYVGTYKTYEDAAKARLAASSPYTMTDDVAELFSL
jgi:hypothetical protein